MMGFRATRLSIVARLSQTSCESVGSPRLLACDERARIKGLVWDKRATIDKRATMALFACLLIAAPVLGEGDPRGEKNLAGKSDLPQGGGLAANAESPLSSHPDVIFAEDFQRDGYRDRWDSVRDDENAVLSIEREGEERFLKVTATLGRNTGGGLTKWFESNDRLFLRFYVRFDPDCDYIHHFCTLRANKAIRGRDAWSGFGGAGNRPEGSERFSTALEPWGDWGRNRPPGRWNFYSYWHEMSGSPDGKYWGNAFRPAQQPLIKRGEWICAEFMIDHNTPGRPDGEQAFWMDGKLMGHWKGINWRKSGDLWANAFTLESYVTDMWTRQRTNVVYFDDVVIAKSYVGPKGDPR